MDPADIKELLRENDALLRKAKHQIRKNRDKCKDCRVKDAVEDHIRCSECLDAHNKKTAEKRAGKILQRDNKPLMEYDENGKLRYVHRRIMSEILGRPLLDHETVAWRNGVKNDNRPENLILALRSGIPLDDLICPHCSNHYRPKSFVEKFDEEVIKAVEEVKEQYRIEFQEEIFGIGPPVPNRIEGLAFIVSEASSDPSTNSLPSF